jgi:hypothetical protein
MTGLKLCKKCGLEKPFSDFFKDKNAKHGVGGNCKVCKLAYAADRHKASYIPKVRKQPQDRVEITRRSYAKHRDATLARRRESGREDVRQWQAANPEKVLKYKLQWKQNNPHKLSAGSRKRNAAKLIATPSWAASEFEELVMAEMYSLAKMRSEVTGFMWHVDHKVPLISGVVCGLHCSANLQVIPAKTNLSKSNTYWEHMP